MSVNNGRAFEKLVRIVQEALRDSTDTKIFPNYNVEDKTTSKKSREFDIFIMSKVNGYEIKIAIECKDYRKPVSLEKVEAFNSKCSSIKGISKKILVSSKGFQSGAVENAKQLYDIDLYELDFVDQNSVYNWLDLKSMTRLRNTRNVKDFIVVLDDEIVLKTSADELMLNAVVWTQSGHVVSLADVIRSTYLSNDADISKIFFRDAFKIGLSEYLSEVKLSRFIFFSNSSNNMWLTGAENKIHYITKIGYEIECNAIIDKPNTIDVRKYNRHGEDTKVDLITANFLNDNSSIQYVREIDSNKVTAFFTDEKDTFRRMDDDLSFSFKLDDI